MAEHLRNELARSNISIRPHRILTLAKFIEPFTALAEPPESLLYLLIANLNPKFPSYHRALSALVNQAPDLPEISEKIGAQLALRGMALRETRLHAAEPIATGPIILDGFFTLSPAELSILEELARQTQVTVTLPDWPGAHAASARLLASGFTEQHLTATLRHPRRAIQAALSLEQEVEHIAATILERVAAGRQFREMGVILRVRDPYAPALETSFDRFGIPARFHFTDALSAHPAIQYLTGLIRSLLSGWDHADLLTLLRMPVSGIGATQEGDRLDFAIRETLPSHTLESLDQISLKCGAANFGGSGPFRPLLELTQNRLTPTDWSTPLKTLRNLIPPPEIPDQITHVQLQILRSTAAALTAFEKALDTTALALNTNSPITLAQFWPSVESALSIEKLRVPDHRRNVVNVLDVYEARQWELPIAFVCGLNERHFPQYHRDNPLLPDPFHTRERQQEEHFLFDLATSRATEETILSYARFNDKGDPQLRSFFLAEPGEQIQTRILPKPKVHPARQFPDQSPPTLRTLSPTSIESFLQCPFQFFAQKTLRLRTPPEKPRDRLNALVQGSILHRALAEDSLDQVFEEECYKNNIPRTYRTEAVRLELLRHFEAFQADRTWPLNWPRQTEQQFEIALTPELSIRGRIDRLDRGPNNEAIVIDYKYSAAAKIRERIDGDPVQGGLYLSAVERFFNLHPAGMFYCGLRQSVTWEGWHTTIPGLALGEARATLQELIETAERQAIEVSESIASGAKEVRPKDRAKCRYCDFKSICRVESISRASAHSGNPQ